MSRFAPFALIAAAVLLFTSACSHYRLGTGVVHDYDSIFIAPVETNGKMPQATAILTTQIRETFIRDGRLRVVNTPDEADAVLTVSIGSLKREVLTTLPSDGGLARKMGLTLEATATLRDPSGQKTWFADRKISVERQIFTDDGSTSLQAVQQIQAEYQLVPQLAEPLAASLKGAVLDTW
ncbi:MAG: hypothetical protein H7067_08740 [Burkholderiales bacterium]|nr:hypothetical protein [Opitutaceae bacterium]